MKVITIIEGVLSTRGIKKRRCERSDLDLDLDVDVDVDVVAATSYMVFWHAAWLMTIGAKLGRY